MLIVVNFFSDNLVRSQVFPKNKKMSISNYHDTFKYYSESTSSLQSISCMAKPESLYFDLNGDMIFKFKRFHMIVVLKPILKCIQFYLMLIGESHAYDVTDSFFDQYVPNRDSFTAYDSEHPLFVLEYKSDYGVTKVSNVWFRPNSISYIKYSIWYRKMHTLFGRNPRWCTQILNYPIQYLLSRKKFKNAILLLEFANWFDKSMIMITTTHYIIRQCIYIYII